MTIICPQNGGHFTTSMCHRFVKGITVHRFRELTYRFLRKILIPIKMTRITSTVTENNVIVLHVPEEKGSFNVSLLLYISFLAHSCARLRNE